MKTIRFILCFSAILISLSFSVNSSILNVDTSKSKVVWTGYKSSGQHQGTLNLSEGYIKIVEGLVVEGSFAIDMHSILVTDSDSKRLLKHLKSEDFFDVYEFPIANFKVKKSFKIDDQLFVKGNLSIKDSTQELIIPVSLTKEDEAVTLESDIVSIKRTDYNIRYKSQSLIGDIKNNQIKEEFDIKVYVVFK